jgi:hypothetical protein
MATVTLTLKEYESLKNTITHLQNKNEELLEVKKPIKFVRLSYDFSKGTSVFNAFGLEVINEDDFEYRFNEIVKSNFDTVFVESKQNKFYNKFPNWVHKLLKCK